MNFLIPGKTFLTGEYSVLVGGAALGIATKPCFSVQTDSNAPTLDIHPESPAGRYLIKKNMSSMKIQFEDPYSSLGILGGFGKSTAEFLAVARADLSKNNFAQIRQLYLDLHKSEKTVPSGVDLGFQFFGKVCLANPQTNEFKSYDWPFLNLFFFVVATGLKIKTFQHLSSLDSASLKKLPRVSDLVIESFLQPEQNLFMDRLQEWTQALQSAGLTHEHSLKLKNELQKNKDILLVKPCGALGADVLLVFCETAHAENVREFVNSQKLKIVADCRDLCDGMVSYVD